MEGDTWEMVLLNMSDTIWGCGGVVDVVEQSHVV